MSEDQKNNSGTPKPGDEKKEYSKPSVTSEPIYETLALACTKRPGQGGLCNASPKHS
jgi:hypothetical protein